MKRFYLISFVLFYSMNNCLSTLVDGIVTLSWSPTESAPIVDRFLTNNSQIQLKILCREKQTTKNSSKLSKTIANTKIRGRIGRIVGCLPLQSDILLTSSIQQDKTNEKDIWIQYYNRLWQEMEQRTFVASQTDCDYTGTHLNIDFYSDIKKPEITPQQASQFREKQNQINKNKRIRRATNDIASTSPGTLLTWGDGYYLIEIYSPEIANTNLDIDVILAITNCYGGYITADEHSALVFYGIMCAIYALFAVLWFVWCAFYWKELLKIQFWIGGVILIGMIEKSAFLAEYDTLNKNGYKVYYAIIAAEILSCLKRTVSRMLVIIVALGYGIVKPRLGPLKQKVLAIGLVYFGIASTEAILRINTRNDETNNKVLSSRIPLAIIDAIIYYWIFSGLVATTRQLRLKKNLVKLNVYRHFTNTILFAIFASLLFMIWSLKSHFFTTCITNWREFWIDDAFWHILFSIILLVIMFLFRPSNNNQRYAFVPLLDQSDTDDDDFNDNNDDRNESGLVDSITMRKASTVESGKNKQQQQQQNSLNREGNMSNDGNGIEDALTWVEANIPTSIADQALQALDSEDEIINTKLQRSKMQ